MTLETKTKRTYSGVAVCIHLLVFIFLELSNLCAYENQDQISVNCLTRTTIDDNSNKLIKSLLSLEKVQGGKDLNHFSFHSKKVSRLY